MIVVTTESVPGYEVKKTLGTVFGLTVRARGLGKDIMAAFKGLFGGEISQYTEMLEDARKYALDRMIENAAAMGANAIIMVRFDSGSLSHNMSEIVAYGTAVIVEMAE
ncbi:MULTISPECIES: YbjQ family protein [unclassified Bacillus (in: firmicutes)]|uniref:YbjQ family protein n=1 Tax=unclassified Bacillus (in: firmicutes) TaxID=185979 RepID=UPI003D2107EE